VLLGTGSPAGGALIVTYGDAAGPAGLYVLDEDVLARLRTAVLGPDRP
jgi:hypothetical protein